MDLVSSSSAVASALGNIGPGFGLVGPSETFSSISFMGKLLLSLLMLLGRLELFTIIALVLPKTWRNEIF